MDRLGVANEALAAAYPGCADMERTEDPAERTAGAAGRRRTSGWPAWTARRPASARNSRRLKFGSEQSNLTDTRCIRLDSVTTRSVIRGSSCAVSAKWPR